MSVNTDRVIARLREAYPDDTYVGGAASEELVRQAEIVLGVALPPSYRAFLARYGTLSLAPNEIYGLTLADREGGLGEPGAPSTVGFTLESRADVGLPQGLVVLVNHDGVEYDCLDTNAPHAHSECPVVRWNVPTRGRVIVPVAPSFDAYLAMMLEEFEASIAEA